MDKSAQSVSDFLKTKKVLVVEPSSSFSSTINQILLKLGCVHTNIFREYEFPRAEQVLREKPEIIISEYHIGSRYGLELAEKQARYIEDAANRTFILATGNSNDSAVAEAAEEEDRKSVV